MDFQALLRDKYAINLNSQQLEAALNTEGPMLLLAVPGSGKTTVIVARCANMVLCRGIAPESILTLTFNRSAQRDMEARFQRIFGADVHGALRFATIHSFCNSVLREYGALVGRKVPRLIEEGKAGLLRRLYATHNDGEYMPDDKLEELSNMIGYVKNMMMTTEEIKAGHYEIKNFSRIFVAYEQYKGENGYMDFDDMLDKALAVFRVKPQVLEKFRNQYHYINVDEAQDTSKLQHAIIRLLAAPHNNLFMVGDEDQSIYMFRAANPGYLLEFGRIYPNARILYMERNYRSTHQIVDAAGRLIRKNTIRHDKAMNTGNEIGMPLEMVSLPDNSGLCDYIVQRLQAAPAGSRAILYRDNTSAVMLMDALDRAGMPFYVREHTLHFFDHWVVKDILAFLALGHNPADVAALKQVYYKLNAYISRDLFAQAAETMERGGCGSVFDALLQNPLLKENSASRIKKLKETLGKLPGMQPGRALQHIMEKAGYSEYLKKTGGEGYYLESLLHIVESMKAVASFTESYEALLERIAAMPGVMQRANANWARDAVTLSTVHSAKGLEFDSVMLVDLFDGRFPTAAAIKELEDGKKELMEEERRLFYVAVTRARRHVELICSGSIFGERVKPSRFIRELLPPAPRKPKTSRVERPPESLAQPKAHRMGAPAAGARPVIEPGMEIAHKTFGRGQVMAYDAEHDIVAVSFPKYGIKTLAAAYCTTGAKKARQPDQDDRYE